MSQMLCTLVTRKRKKSIQMIFRCLNSIALKQGSLFQRSFVLLYLGLSHRIRHLERVSSGEEEEAAASGHDREKEKEEEARHLFQEKK